MHTLILGQTRSGKTTWAIQHAQRLQKLGYKICVYAPAFETNGSVDRRWAFADFTTTDRTKALAQFWKPGAWKLMWFFDEAQKTIGTHDPEMEDTALRGSAKGATCHYIAQRGALFNRSVREQCTRLVMFRQGPKDCKTLYEDWGQRELLQGARLGKGQAIYCTTEAGSARGIDLKLR